MAQRDELVGPTFVLFNLAAYTSLSSSSLIPEGLLSVFALGSRR